MNQNAAGYSLADFKFALRARWTSVVLVGSILLIGGSYLTVKKPVSYQVRSSLAFTEAQVEMPVFRSSTDVRPMTPSVRTQARAELMSGVLFLKVIDKYEVSKRWNLENRADTLKKMKRLVTVVYRSGDGTVEIIARDATPGGAAMLANAIADEFVDQKELEAQLEAEDRIRSLNLELESRRESVAEISQQLRESSDSNAELNEKLREDLVRQSHLIRSLEARHQLAVVENREARPIVSILNTAIADEASLVTGRWYLPAVLGLLGIALGVIMVGLFAVRSAPLQVATNLKNRLDLLLVGFAPVPSAPLAKLSRAADSIVEPYRFLRNSIQKLPAGDCSMISFLSADPDSELPSVISNLSVIIAEAGHTVLLIDGDLRNPQVYRQFDAANHPGLSDYLTGEMRLEETVVKTRKNNLWFMPSGPPREDPSGLFSGKRMQDLIYDMKSRFDYLLITSPSPLSYSEAGVVSGMVDHTIAVTSYKRHSGKTLKQLKQALESSGGILSGVALSQLLFTPEKAAAPESAPSNEVKMPRKPVAIEKPRQIQDEKPRRIESRT
ncbi:MAG: hypothetical protein P1U58_02120 [Verrucomicrobiales bacterium]|nr:hypothetical protein [Verrucomicrobiales bacterium]